MNKDSIKTAMMSAISEEIDFWLDKEGSIGDGYQYETEFMKTTRKVNQIMLAKSLGAISVDRNKKNFTRVLGNSK